MDERDQRIYKIVYTGSNGLYDVMADEKCIARSVAVIGEVVNAIFCNYTDISEDELFIDDCKVAKHEEVEKILKDLRGMFIGIKVRRGLKDCKVCGLLIGENINESKRSKTIQSRHL